MFRRYTISEIGDIISGATPKTNVLTNFGGEIPWLTPADLSGYTEKYISHGARNLTQQGYDSCSTHLIPAGTVLLSSRAPIGYVAIAKNEICTNQGFKSIVPKAFVNSEFLYYQLKSLKNTLQNLGSGTTFKELSAKKLATVQVVIPSLEEQKSIVSKIEELFSKLDASVAELKTAKEKLKVYRQAVLKEVFTGLSNKRPIREMTSIVTSGSRGWAKYYSNSGAKFIRIGNLTRDSIKIDLSEPQYVSPPVNAEGARTKLQPNDVLVSITADLGSIGLVTEVVGEAYINQHIALVRFKNSEQSEFMAWYLRSDWGQKDLLKNKRGAGKLGLGLNDVRDAKVPVVSDEQAKTIVSEISGRLSVCDSIEQTVDTSLQKAEALRQSILKQAFEGRLL